MTRRWHRRCASRRFRSPLRPSPYPFPYRAPYCSLPPSPSRTEAGPSHTLSRFLSALSRRTAVCERVSRAPPQEWLRASGGAADCCEGAVARALSACLADPARLARGAHAALAHLQARPPTTTTSVLSGHAASLTPY
jgi:hypothetical protein